VIADEPDQLARQVSQVTQVRPEQLAPRDHRELLEPRAGLVTLGRPVMLEQPELLEQVDFRVLLESSEQLDQQDQ